MSNMAYVYVNKVENIKTGKVFYEINIFDSYGYASIDIEKEQTSMTDIDALQYLKDCDSDEVVDLVDVLLTDRVGVTINDTFYEWNEIKHLFGME